MLTKNEEKILKSIEGALNGDGLPKFPVTPTFRIDLKGFDNVWLKDESRSETGTHKDRMAWEIVSTYRDILINKKQGNYNFSLPRLSIISAGSAALAIQTQMRKYSLPNLKILIDDNANPSIVKSLRGIGCEIYITDLEKKPLSVKDILDLTDNREGFDITSNRGFDPSAIKFYDWLSYEILNESPDIVFTPFGTGQLYENILNIARKIITDKADEVYSGDKSGLPLVGYFGATTSDIKSKAVKLYAPFRPFTTVSNEWIRLFALRGYCGSESKIVEVKEEFIDEAFEYFKKNNILAEHSGVAGLALLLQMRREIPRDKKIVILNTGCAKLKV